METQAKYYESTRDTATEQPPAYSPTSGQPNLPSYEDVERDAPPPSYDSLFGRARSLRAESSGNVNFVMKMITLFIGTIGFTVFIALMLAVPVAMIVIGVKYKDDCPAERYIPIYLIVAGSFGAFRNLIHILRRCCCQKDEEEEDRKKVNPLESVIDCFMFAWFIAGNVWIYRTKGEFSTTPDDPNFCDPTLYWFAFWITTSVYIIMACCCCCCCCCGVFAVFLNKDKPSNNRGSS